MHATYLIGQRSRSRLAPFRLHRPHSVEDAVERSAAHPGAVYMAGGLDLIARMKEGATPTDVIHLGSIPELSQILRTPTHLRIGAAARHHDIACHPEVRTWAPDLADVWKLLANPRVRYAGTVGGNLMASNASYDAAPILAALGATARFTDARGARTMAVAQAAGDAALLVSIDVPVGTRLLVDRSMRPVASVALGLDIQNGLIARARVGIGCAYVGAAAWQLPIVEPLAPVRLAMAADATAASFARSLPDPVSDWKAGTMHRRRIVAALLRRLLERAADLK